MNGKDIKIILPLAVVGVLILAAIGIALMGKEKKNENKDETGPYLFQIGPVTDVNGSPLEGVELSLDMKDGNIKTGKTNETGMAEFQFEGEILEESYVLMVKLEKYIDSTLSLNLSIQDDRIIAEEFSSSGKITLIKEPLPPVELMIGAVTGPADALEGAKVELYNEDVFVKAALTDALGKAVFSFQTPPQDGMYSIRVNLTGYVDSTVEFNLTYNAEEHSLIPSIELNGLSLSVFIPEVDPNDEGEEEEEKEKLDYYKDLDGYQELEETKEKPVDLETRFDPDSDGEPEYYSMIEEETQKEVDTDEYLPVIYNEPAYSPEISDYEPIEPEPYLAMQTRSSGRSGRDTEHNLTHMTDFLNKNEILDNGTTDIMIYDTDVIQPNEMGAFQGEVGDVGSYIQEAFEYDFINGSNSTDNDGDGRPEALVIWKMVQFREDRNGDNVTDHIISAISIAQLWDNNSNGIVEHSKGFNAVREKWDNNSDGHFEDVKTAVALGDEAKIDGNITDHYKHLGVFYNHTVDIDDDNIFEIHRAVIYVTQYYDNNSNGHYELGREFAGGFEGIDENSNGQKESWLMVWAGKELKDTNDDGSDDINNSIVWIWGMEDQNEDSVMENITLLMISHQNFDNNSNGIYEDCKSHIAGLRIMDADSDNIPEEKDAVWTFMQEWDRNDDGDMDANASIGLVFLWKDEDEDSNPEEQTALHYAAANYDNNSNGHFELTKQYIAGLKVTDPDSDGVLNELFVVQYYVEREDMNDEGNVDHEGSLARVLHTLDSDGDGNIEYKHAIFGAEQKWDNNTDGHYESVDQFLAGYNASDPDDDGNINQESFFILFNQTYDNDNDGNPETLNFSLMASQRMYDNNGTVIYGRNVFHHVRAFDNNSNGHFEFMKSIMLGNEGFNGTVNGTNVDWQIENVLLIYTEMRDEDDDGVWDDHNFIRIEF